MAPFARRLVVALLVVAASAVTTTGPAWAAGGSARIVAPNSSAPERTGGPSTQFSVALPSGAKCPGDTAHAGYSIFSFLVPAGTDPTSLTFTGGVPSRGYGLFTTSEYYGGVNTEPFTGRIPAFPADLTWQRLSASQLLAESSRATWTAGVLCESPRGQVQGVWSVAVTFHRSGSGSYTWTAVSGGTARSRHVGRNVAIIAVVVIILLTIVGATLIRLRRSARDVQHA